MDKQEHERRRRECVDRAAGTIVDVKEDAVENKVDQANTAQDALGESPSIPVHQVVFAWMERTKTQVEAMITENERTHQQLRGIVHKIKFISRSLYNCFVG